MKPIYTSLDSVKIRLVNKVQFQSSEKDYEQGEMPNALVCQIIADAETEIEMELRGRYQIPFQSKRTGKFADLPDHTQRAIRKVVDLKAVMMILETDFGRGTHITAEGYVDKNKEMYDEAMDLLLGRDRIGKNQHERYKMSPPLEDLLLAKHNRKADDGFRGRIINTDASTDTAENYAQDQINNPSQGYLSKKPGSGIGVF